jgi:hypothetical protein
MTKTSYQGPSEGRNRASSLRLFTLVIFIAAMATGIATDGGPQSRDERDKQDVRDDRYHYAIGVWGDIPYSDVQALTGVRI